MQQVHNNIFSLFQLNTRTCVSYFLISSKKHYLFFSLECRVFAVDNNPSYKKLYRSKKEKMIAGVCGGLAEHFVIDPT